MSVKYTRVFQDKQETPTMPTIQLPPTVLVIDLLLSEDEAFIRNLILDLMDNRKMEWSLE